MSKTNLLVLTTAFVVVACGNPEILAPRDSAVPVTADLSGNWQIQVASARDQRRIREAIRKTDGVDDDAIFGQRKPEGPQGGRSSKRSRIKGGLVDVFLELGESLKITQTEHGLFISFDRSVVEEYLFGENRMASVGEVQAQRVTGWEGNTLVIETLDRNKMKLTERFRVIENSQVLERTIDFRSKEMEERSVVQLFDRVGS